MVRQALTELAMLGRLARDLPAFLRTPITVEQAVATVRRRLEARPERFLRMAERAIYGYPRSPYLRMLRAAGCEVGDLRALVTSEGLEGALGRLAEAGVYVTVDELKGRREAVRGSRRFAFVEADFDNPHADRHVESPTSGSGGAPSRVGRGLPFIGDLAIADALAFDAHGVSRPRHVIWHIGPTPLLGYAKLGQPTIGWVYPLRPLSVKARVGARYLALLGRLGGCSFPGLRFAALADPGRMADWLCDSAATGSPICVTTYVSSAVRVAIAARDAGISLGGVAFVLHGEPITDVRRRTVEAAGARVIPRYSTVEGGHIGFGCGNPRAPDDIHLLEDRFGLVRRTRMLDGLDVTVDALLLTSLLPSAPKLLLNVETGDDATLERRTCACKLGALGLDAHLSQVRSFEKLTGEGMTFVRTDLLRVLEEVLPARFGGTSGDYQVLEQERSDGITRLLLLVSPQVGAVDEPTLRRVFLEELGGDDGVHRFMTSVWRVVGTVEVRRRAPIATRSGKILPFHLARAGGAEGT